MRPDIALIAPYPRNGTRHDGDSGVASYSANLAHALADLGARVAVVAPEVEGEAPLSRDGAIEVCRTFRTGGVNAVPSALAAARRTGAPVVHLQHELFLYAGAAGLPATLAALRRRANARTVITMHQVVAPAAVTTAYTRMHRVRVPARVARTAIGLVQQTLSTTAAAVIVHEPAFRSTIPGALVVPHGIEVPPTPLESRAALRRRLGIPERGLTALCFGFLAPYKGLETALEAAELAGEQIHLVVAGGPHPRLVASGDDYAARLRDRWGATARFTGYVPDAAVPDWFRAADVALLCYPEPHASSGPLALALAHRTPVLLSDRLAATVAANPQLAVTGPAGAWARRLQGLTTDPDQLDGLRRQVQELARDRSWPAVAARHLEIYRGVTDRDHPAPAALSLA